MRREKKNQIIRVLAERIRGIILNEGIDFATLQEIRLREGQPLVIRCDGEEKLFAHIVTREELRETMEYIAVSGSAGKWAPLSHAAHIAAGERQNHTSSGYGAADIGWECLSCRAKCRSGG